MEKLRNTQIYKKGEWQDIDFTELKKGDLFRMFELDGKPVKGQTDAKIFEATSELYDHDEYHVPTIETVEHKELPMINRYDTEIFMGARITGVALLVIITLVFAYLQTS